MVVGLLPEGHIFILGAGCEIVKPCFEDLPFIELTPPLRWAGNIGYRFAKGLKLCAGISG